jgi:hypothetical protein
MTLDSLSYLVLLAVAIRLIARFVAAVVAEVNRQLTTMPRPNCGTQMPCKDACPACGHDELGDCQCPFCRPKSKGWWPWKWLGR